jgi:hypothetical protein
MGIVSTLGYDFIHGSESLYGLGIPELYHTCYSKQLECLSNHLWKRTQTGKLMTMLLEAFAIEAGTMKHIFEEPRNSRIEQWLITKDTWVRGLRRYVIDNGINIDLGNKYFSPQRNEDKCLMDALDLEPTLTAADLQAINVCCIFKKVTYLSDIATGDGERIATWAWDSLIINNFQTYQFPTQDNPTPTQWKAWRKGLKSLLQHGTQRLKHFLGNWTLGSEKYFENWEYYINPTSKLLLRYDLQYKKWHQLSTNCPITLRYQTFNTASTKSTSITPSVGWYRTSTFEDNEIVYTEGYSLNQGERVQIDHLRQSSGSSLITTIKIKAQHFHDSLWALKYIESSDSITNLLSDFANGKARMVGDGSFSDMTAIGAGAFIVASEDCTQFIIAGGPTPGTNEVQSPYRSELSTILGMGIMATILSQITNSSPQIIVACDNDNALKRPFSHKSELSASQKSIDLIATAHEIWEKLPTYPIPTKVKGHADTLSRQLTVLEELNIIVDSKAKEYLARRTTSPIYRTTDTHYGMIQISVNNENVSGTIASTISNTMAMRRMKNALIRHNKITDQHWANLDCVSIERSQQHTSRRQKIFSMKWMAKQLPVGIRMQQRKHRLSDVCPCCKLQQETVSHLLTCNSTAAVSAYYSSLETFQKWLDKMHTDPIISIHLIATLQSLRATGKVSPNLFPNILNKKKYYEAFQAQNKIGWMQFHEGLITKQWAILQDQHYKAIGHRRSGKTWASELITQLWHINHSIWIHRNEILHHSDQILDELHGKPFLLEAITYELNLGKSELHQKFFPFFFFLYNQHNN